MQLSGVRLAWLFVYVLCWPALSGAGQGSVQDPGGGSVADPLRSELAAAAEKVLLPGRCGECHAAEYDVWKGTVHSTGFDTLHRSARSREISGNLGLRLIRRSSGEATPVCLGCHYTPTLRRGQLRAGAGVSCESCHGPARDWVSIHSSYGVATADPQLAPRLETARHRTRRIAESTAAGMRRPSQIYELASACFGCHAVPNEELVNRGGHSTGSDFELVEWNGLIQHNFLESYKAGDGWTNAERPRDWKRIMYVVGRTLDVEYALRGIGAATEDGPYLAAARDRLGAALDDLLEIDDRVDAPEIRRIAAIAERAELALDDFGPLDVADAVRAATKAFIAESDGSTLAQLDPLWDEHLAETVMPARPTREAAAVRRDRAPIESDARPTARSSPPAANGAGSGIGGSPAAGMEASTLDRSAASTRTAAAALAPHTPPVVTLSRPPWRDPPVHAFVRVPCGRCHSEQLEWWRRDPHSTAACAATERRRQGVGDCACLRGRPRGHGAGHPDLHVVPRHDRIAPVAQGTCWRRLPALPRSWRGLSGSARNREPRGVCRARANRSARPASPGGDLCRVPLHNGSRVDQRRTPIRRRFRDRLAKGRHRALGRRGRAQVEFCRADRVEGSPCRHSRRPRPGSLARRPSARDRIHRRAEPCSRYPGRFRRNRDRRRTWGGRHKPLALGR